MEYITTDQQNYISHSPFTSFQALKLPFSYTLTQSSFISHTQIFKLSFPRISAQILSFVKENE